MNKTLEEKKLELDTGFLYEVGYSEALLLHEDGEAYHGKLFLLSREYIGETKTEASEALLREITAGLFADGGKPLKFLFLGDGVKLLGREDYRGIWERALMLGSELLAAASSADLFSAACPPETRLLTAEEIAYRLISHEVVTLS